MSSHHHVDQVESSARHNNRPNQRFSRDKDRHRDRHTVERERNVGKSSRFEQDDSLSPTTRRYNTTGRINREFNQSHPPRGQRNPKNPGVRSQSLDRRARRDTPDPDFDQEPPFKTPVLCNKYAIDELDRGTNRRKNPHASRFQNRIRNNQSRSQSVPRPLYGNQLDLPSPSPPRRSQSSYNYSNYDDFNDDLEMQPVKKIHKRKDRPGEIIKQKLVM